MEKYTDLEQAVRDSSLVIITDAITTQKELNKVYSKYRVLSGKQKRFSNYDKMRIVNEGNLALVDIRLKNVPGR